MLSMAATPARPTSVRRVVLVPAGPTSSRARGDELVRRYRLARLRIAGNEATPVTTPLSRRKEDGGTLGS
jgi:hypothetical protein